MDDHEVTKPLLKPAVVQSQSDDSNTLAGDVVVNFEAAGDPENPLNWPDAFKWTLTAMLAAMAFTV
jgi:hypothetical protein